MKNRTRQFVDVKRHGPLWKVFLDGKEVTECTMAQAGPKARGWVLIYSVLVFPDGVCRKIHFGTMALRDKETAKHGKYPRMKQGSAQSFALQLLRGRVRIERARRTR